MSERFSAKLDSRSFPGDGIGMDLRNTGLFPVEGVRILRSDGFVNLPYRIILLNSRRRLRLKCDGTRAETRFRLSAKRTSPFKSAGASIQSITGSRGVRISCSNAGYTMFRGSVKGTGYPLHSPVSPSLPHPCVTVCHHISTGVYLPSWHCSSRNITSTITPGSPRDCTSKPVWYRPLFCCHANPFTFWANLVLWNTFFMCFR